MKISILFASNVNSFFFTFELHAIDLPLVELFNAFSSAAVVDFLGTEITENKMKKNNKNSHIFSVEFELLLEIKIFCALLVYISIIKTYLKIIKIGQTLF